MNIFTAGAERLIQRSVNRRALAALISSCISAVFMDDDGAYGLVIMWDDGSDISLLVGSVWRGLVRGDCELRLMVRGEKRMKQKMARQLSYICGHSSYFLTRHFGVLRNDCQTCMFVSW